LPKPFPTPRTFTPGTASTVGSIAVCSAPSSDAAWLGTAAAFIVCCSFGRRMGITRRGVSARGGVAISRSGAETSACTASLTSGFVSTSGWAGLSADAEVEKTKVNKQRTGAARVIWLACMLSPLEARPRVAPSPSSFWFRIKGTPDGGIARFKLSRLQLPEDPRAPLLRRRGGGERSVSDGELHGRIDQCHFRRDSAALAVCVVIVLIAAGLHAQDCAVPLIPRHGVEGPKNGAEKDVRCDHRDSR